MTECCNRAQNCTLEILKVVSPILTAEGLIGASRGPQTRRQPRQQTEGATADDREADDNFLREHILFFALAW